MTTPSSRLHDYLPARFNTAAERQWIPSATPGKSSSPLRFFADDRGFVELLRMEPGVVMPLHRHSGEIHAYNLSGTRKLCTGELIGPGGYVYEPPGNTDWWKIVGDETMLALVVVMGTVEFLGPGGVVTGRASASTQLAEYERYCREHGLAIQDLVD
ncbi:MULTISPECIES: cupin domain-containing protein [unclassified Rhodanobacter]|uniref:cupin domain-containing protein n=1 Tax=unclassified Rhodanobacter TaxID=2621553 RepID=UPI001BDDF82C|nr:MULTISPECIES: cupin domain-containing protein [unclassified Rhodanobacter]MBT2142799.1 cupin domain-containing protein [Rhodanobacter sp. LX-99]MBT2148128.1 cupin domain-containing protein [Rhodanobacter sp. LX-100]